MVVELKVKVPKQLIACIDLLVKMGICPNRNEAIRTAIRLNLEGKNV